MADTVRKYWERLRKEGFSPTFVISRLLLRANIGLPIPLTFYRRLDVRTYFHPSSAAHKLFIGRYKPQLDIAVFERFIAPGAIAFDVGANIGMFSILAARLTGATGRVYALEPTAASFAYLLENLRLNATQNVYPFNIAISKTGGVASLIDHTYSKEQNRLATAEESGHAVLTARLDAFAAAFNIHHVDFLKIDVEGAELHVLESLGTDIANVDTIYLEFNDRNYVTFGYSKRDIVSFLTSKGFELMVPRLEHGSLYVNPLDDTVVQTDTNCNVIAIRKNCHNRNEFVLK